jgi:hypothetical protein
VHEAGLGDDVIPAYAAPHRRDVAHASRHRLWQAAGFLGMTVEMLSARYGHHHPDHLSGATRAFKRHREVLAEALAG